MGLCHDLRWLRRARKSQYDLILVSDKYLLACIASVVARIRGQRFLFWLTFPFHTKHINAGRERLAREPVIAVIRGHISSFALRRWIIPLSDHLFVQSARMADDFRALGASAARLTPIVTGIDLAGVSPAARRTTRESSRPITVVYLGTLVRERRLEILVDMLAELRRRGVHAKLLLVGDGAAPEDRLSIQRRAAELGLADQVVITGFLPRQSALELARTADIGVSPFHPSPILDVASPTKLLEYLALGLPVVANSHPDQTTVLRESRAGVVVPWGARHFARAVHWLTRRGDAELAVMALRGQAWVEENRSYARIADTFERTCLMTASR
jgi:glycosyltransferase involved in cell wall biosynthesis